MTAALTALHAGAATKPNVITDSARKIYACQNEPHLFGYCGWVKFPVSALAKLVEAADQGGFFNPSESAEERQTKVARYLETELQNVIANTVAVQSTEFVILHAAREGQGMTAVFRLWILGWSPGSSWNIRERNLTEESEILFAGGSGSHVLLQREGAWRGSEIGRTSRGVFSAFCEALKSGLDDRSGGPPQLGGLFRKGRAMEFGIVYNRLRYLGGRPIAVDKIPKHLEWFNELLERIDPIALGLLPQAQRHAKPSWLREPG